MVSRRAAVLESVSGHVPAHVVHNSERETLWGVDDAWIRRRTGIVTRHHAEPGTSTGHLAVRAAEQALAAAGGPPVDVLIVATSTPDRQMPATAPAVATRLGLGLVAAFDVSAACSGFVYALAVCQGLIIAGTAERVLLVSAETLSRLTRPTDGKSGPLLADGAGAVLLRAGAPDEQGALLAFDLGSDGTGYDLVTVRAGGAEDRAGPEALPEDERYFNMAGRDVFQRAVIGMADSTQRVLTATGWSPGEVDRIVPHQANARIMTTVADRLALPEGRLVSNVSSRGNTGAASIPLALADAMVQGRLRPGHRVVLTAFGAGLTWGSATLVWPDLKASSPVYPSA